MGLYCGSAYELGWGYGCLTVDNHSLLAEAKAVKEALLAILYWTHTENPKKRSTDNVYDHVVESQSTNKNSKKQMSDNCPDPVHKVKPVINK